MKEFLKQYIEKHKDEMLKDLADFVGAKAAELV